MSTVPSQTDGQTDGRRTTYDSNTALALRASRGKKDTLQSSHCSISATPPWLVHHLQVSPIVSISLRASCQPKISSSNIQTFPQRALCRLHPYQAIVHDGSEQVIELHRQLFGTYFDPYAYAKQEAQLPLIPRLDDEARS